MNNKSIYEDIATRTGGDIYIGVVGPVRTGKSTFIKRFMDSVVLPNMNDDNMRQRATDELPQSSAGRTIMTTEPKFVPENAVKITLPDNASFNVRLIDCVGYIVDSSLGYIENDMPRMVRTPWYENEIPFNMAAEIGTKKVISEHSTIGLVITTDGSISDIPRSEYEEAERRVIEELKELQKPFVVLLNCLEPESAESRQLQSELCRRYNVPVMAVSCIQLTEKEIKEIITQILFEFPVKEIGIDLPLWLVGLSNEHWLKSETYKTILNSIQHIEYVRDIATLTDTLCESEYILKAEISSMDLSVGSARISVKLQNGLFYKIMAEETGIEVEDEQSLLTCLKELSLMKKEYSRIQSALEEVQTTGYGIVMPTIDELTLEEPEIMKQGGRYGVRLCASAPSIHLMKTDIRTEVAPIVGSESQSEELVKYLLAGFEEDPHKIWESNIFGKSLNELVNEGLCNKLYHLPTDARMKFQETLERVINEGCNGLLCIIL
ncbi:MAG: stage IV sporulation protein A [Clostridia bacterium]|nr:stage IV sporulation protein A [Clostridia bacterium]